MMLSLAQKFFSFLMARISIPQKVGIPSVSCPMRERAINFMMIVIFYFSIRACITCTVGDPFICKSIIIHLCYPI